MYLIVGDICKLDWYFSVMKFQKFHLEIKGFRTTEILLFIILYRKCKINVCTLEIELEGIFVFAVKMWTASARA